MVSFRIRCCRFLIRCCDGSAWKYFKRFKEIAPVIRNCTVNFRSDPKFFVNTVYSFSNNIMGVGAYHPTNR